MTRGRDATMCTLRVHKHVGIYAYRYNALRIPLSTRLAGARRVFHRLSSFAIV